MSNIPEGYQPKADAMLGAIGNGLERLMVDGALPLDTTNKEEILTATYQLTQGPQIDLKLLQHAVVTET